MSWWAAIGDWSAKAVDQYMGQDQAHRANRTNIMLQREQRDWAERMSNTEVTRHVADLRKAGLNPMLGYTGQASTPNVAPARVEPTYVAGKDSAKPAIMEAMMMQSMIDKSKAEARLTNAQASLEEEKVPHGAQSAQQSVDKVQEEIVRLGQEIEMGDIAIKSAAELKPLLIDAQKLVNRALEFGLSRKELEQDVAKMLQIPFNYAAEAIRRLNDFGSSLGDSAADFRDWLLKAKQDSKKDWKYDPKTKTWHRF